MFLRRELVSRGAYMKAKKHRQNDDAFFQSKYVPTT